MTILNEINAKAAGWYAAAIVICIAIMIWVMELWNADLNVPFSYMGDSIFTGVLVKGLIDNGWYLHNPFLGAPYDQYIYDFPFSNSLDFIILRIISLFSFNYAKTMNLYFLLTFPLTTLTSMLVLRQLKNSYATSILGSLLYTFLSYHFWRGEGHLFLAAYYMIPLMVMVLFWVYSDKNLILSEVSGRIQANVFNKKTLLCIIICILISSTFIYYPFFSCFFLIVTGISASFLHRSKKPLITSLVFVALITAGVLINISPTIIYQHDNGNNPITAIRTPDEAEYFGLKIIQLLMPISSHRISFLASVANKYIDTAPLCNHSAPSLGMIIGIGFLLLIGWILYRLSGDLALNIKQYDVLNKLSILNLSALLLATVGGFSSIFSYSIAYLFPFSPQFRCYDRISIFIAFFSMTAIVILLDAFSNKYIKTKSKKIIFYGLLVVLLIAGVLDQTGRSYVSMYPSIKAEYLSDQDFINRIEATMPQGAMIFQLPYMPFPEYVNIYKMTDYTHFKGYLHSRHLHWSYGAMKGRQEDAWQSGVAGKPVEEFVKILSQAGFRGIYIDSFGYKDDGVGIISNLSYILKTKPLISTDKRLYFFNMTNYSKISSTDLVYTQAEGWYSEENSSGIPTRWMGKDGTVFIYSEENRTVNLSLQALSFHTPRTLELYANNELAKRILVPIDFINVSAPIHVKKGENLVLLHTLDGCESPSTISEMKSQDLRCLSIAVRNITISL